MLYNTRGYFYSISLGYYVENLHKYVKLMIIMNIQSRDAVTGADVFFNRVMTHEPVPRFPVQRYGTIYEVIRTNLEAMLPDIDRHRGLTTRELMSWVDHYEDFIGALAYDMERLAAQKRKQLETRMRWRQRSAEFRMEDLAQLPSEAKQHIFEFLPFETKVGLYMPLRTQQTRNFMSINVIDLRDFFRKFMQEFINAPITSLATGRLRSAYGPATASEIMCAIESARPRVPNRKRDIVMSLFVMIDDLNNITGSAEARSMCSELALRATRAMQLKALFIRRRIQYMRDHSAVKEELTYLDGMLKRALKRGTPL